MNRIEQQWTGCRWRRFSHKTYAVFRSLHREVSIGVLGVEMLSSCAFVNPQGELSDKLERGDLLFCYETDDDGGLGGAIAAVTEGAEQLNITHVAVMMDDVRVLEATPRGGVRVINLSEFLKDAGSLPDGTPRVLASRLQDTTGVARSVERALTYVGRPYDFLYQPDDSAVYCSELVQLSFQRLDGTSVFEQQPMSFRDSTGEIAPYWVKLYADHQMEVPEGLPSTNPGALSRSSKVRKLYVSFPPN